MLQSSLGFHTMTISLSLSHKDCKQLLMDFVKYRDKTKSIQIYWKNEDNKYIIYYPRKNYPMLLPIHVKVSFCGKDQGVKWQIRYNSQFSDFSTYLVEATINPKLLAGVSDYLTAAAFCDMDMAITKYYLLCREISPLLGKFDDYQIKRIDYCFNASLNDFMPTYDPGQIMNLIKRSGIPSHYEEWMVYDSVAHRMKSRPESFYLCSKSVNINCYSKYLQLLNRSQENIKKGYDPIPQEIIDASHDIIRFEVQCKYHKTYSLNKEAEKSGNDCINKFGFILSSVICIKMVSTYYETVIGKGDWYSLTEAVQIIQSKNFNSQREKRLTDALKYVSQCRSLAKAKASYQGNELAAFKKTLNELAALGINPVTIPREWNIKHIPNFLKAYFDGLAEDLSNHNILNENLCIAHGYTEYCRIFRHSSA